MCKKGLYWVSWLGLLAGTLALAWAQPAALQLAVRKNMGYNLGSQIQGSFQLKIVNPPADLTSVTFWIDATEMGTAAPPFQIDFQTETYAPGWHTFSATGLTAGGQKLTAAARRFEFVTAAQAKQGLLQVMWPVWAVVGVALLVGMAAPVILFRMQKRKELPLGTPRQYGIKGGAICPKCQRPFSIHWYSFNLVARQWDVCDYCGQWSLVRRASPAALTAAEAAEVRLAQPDQPVGEPSPADQRKRQLDDSRFVD